jgi:DNA-binding CsgD family transcriptional regulator
MIVGRTEELGALDALVDDLRAGAGRALVLRGDAGIGKTTLLGALAERGRADPPPARGGGGDVLLLRARGVETESDLAFSALADLLAPVVDQLDELPAPQAAALAAALALGPPQQGDRLAVCVATLGLLRAAAARRPVLAVVDDAHWLDGPSRECLLYAAKRAGGAVGFALAARTPDDAGLERAGLPELALGPVDREASLALLARAAPDLSGPVASALATAAAGNPLALVELPATLSAEQRSGAAALELPLTPGERLLRAFGERVGGLAPAARRSLLVLAAYESDDAATVAAAGADVQALGAAEARGIVRIADGRVAFTHPLVRGAVYRLAPAPERRAAHAALAGALAGERRAWHLAAAAIGPDDEAAAALEEAAQAAVGRRAFASAATALERAARLSGEREPRARRMLAAGEAAAAAGLPERALPLLTAARDAAPDGALRVRAEHRLGMVMLWSGGVEPASHLLMAAAERTAGQAPEQAAAMLADAAAAAGAANDYHRALSLAERAEALLGDGGRPAARAHILSIVGWTLVLCGQTARAAGPLGEATLLAAQLDPLAPSAHWQHLLLRRHITAGEHERALDESLALCERAREAGARRALGGALIVAAEAAYRLGDWEAAAAATDEGIRVAEETAQHIWHGYTLSIRARLTAARGEEPACRAALAGADEIAEGEGILSGKRFVHGARGFLELGLDRIEEAIAELEAVQALVDGYGYEEPLLVPWGPDLVEAHLRAGRPDRAARVLRTVERQARMAGTPAALAPAARCRGMLAEDFDAAFAEALAHDDERPVPFERARTLLALGRRLHRARRRIEARERLREAVAGFEGLGAAPWADQARNELSAAGARRRRARSDALTPQEQRVAAAVARGASNREIAAELFLAPKTIEFHLRQIYRKTGVRSRTQLVAALARDELANQPGEQAPQRRVAARTLEP